MTTKQQNKPSLQCVERLLRSDLDALKRLARKALEEIPELERTEVLDAALATASDWATVPAITVAG